ncbi:phosphatase PAP2 family protein [Actinomycetospora termitidis]|uniref:Phosphatase PAP2 family protein n=1 Tax=Actinomycetospora termitidis TaxID=3053470 RepID=A0ABT7MB40_9PSEU|nr:phosphatase PAP2 family protein [Actinomycetospora sp. Odt1-22]MDL5157848.1 phosphatase PAP2 family protein [Actinomycetospora sp. Odt1-22]
MTTLATRPTVPMHPAYRPGGRWAARVVGGLVLGLLGTVLTTASWLLLVDSASGRRVDHAVMVSVEDLFSGVRGDVLDLLGLVSVATVGLALVVIAAIGLSRRRVGAAVAAVVLVLTSQAITQGLKAVLPREGAGENSLPSGHVTVIGALVIATLLVLPAAARYVAGVVGLVVVAGASVAVVAAGWHRPGDVLAAYGVLAAVGGALLVLDGARRGLLRTS